VGDRARRPTSASQAGGCRSHPAPDQERVRWIGYDSCMADLEATPDGTNSRAAGSLRETVAPWVVALVASGAFALFVELNKTKPDHHTIGVKIGAGVVIWLGVAAIVRFIIFAADQARTR
jgi:hypothetical protein